MARGSTQATGAATSAQNNSNTDMGNAQSIYSTLNPQLANEAANPAGFGPSELADLKTQNMQGAGGGQAAAVGQGALLGARTRNAGAPAAAIASSARTAGQQLGSANLKTNLANDQLKNQQQQEGLAGEEGLFGTNLSGGNTALGQVSGDVNANTQAANSSWDWATDLLDPILQSASSGAAAYAKGGCWIAEAIYGVDDPRTHIVRAWLNGEFRQTKIGSAVMRLYLKIGQQVAAAVRKSDLLAMALKPLFDLALRKALR